MNEEMQNEEQKTGNFWQDKALPFLKGLWADKIKCLYMLVLFLQLLFLLLQFVPFIEIVTEAKISLFGGLEVTKEAFSVFSFAKKTGGVIILFLMVLTLFLLSLRGTVFYFIRKKDKMKNGFFLAKVAVVLYLILFGIFVSAALESVDSVASQVSKYAEVNVKGWFSLRFSAILYVIVGVVLFVMLQRLSVKVKAKKQEDKINARVAEELQKKNEAENAQ
ncbi:MAG: hypothetical protein IJ514_03800 [Clostridia bacterium]|nr:hypothetical protein [Clostridia bacterium]